jgi:drug/metabolite transporter (DMT)-like permease
VWGSSFLLIEVALEGLSPLQIVLGRMCIGAAVLLAVVVTRRLRLPTRPGLWGQLAVVAVTSNVLPYFLFAWAQQSLPSNVAGALNATTPLFTLGLAVALGRESRSSAARVLGLAVGFAGTLVVLAPWQAAGQLGTRGAQLACLAAAASYAVAYVAIDRVVGSPALSPLVLSAGQLTLGAALLLVAAPLYAAEPVALTLPVVASVVVLGALGTGAAYLWNYRLVADVGPTAASVVTYFLPVVAVVLGVAVLAEPLTWNLVVGGLLVLAGAAVAQDRLRVPRSLALTRSGR